jgi:hypothetical protein
MHAAWAATVLLPGTSHEKPEAASSDASARSS